MADYGSVSVSVSAQTGSLLIGICDDSASDAERLRLMLEACLDKREQTYVIKVFHNSDTLLKYIKPGMFHILFLDIYMPGTDGIRCAAIIRVSDQHCKLIFATSSADHAIDSYGVRAAGYLLKPYTPTQLNKVLDWCLSKLTEQLKVLDITSEREKISVLLKDIIYIEVFGRTSIIHTAERDIPTNRSLNELIKHLGDSFLRCHRSFIVNMEHIIRPLNSDFLLTGKIKVPIAIDNKNKIKKIFFEWSFRHTWESN